MASIVVEVDKLVTGSLLVMQLDFAFSLGLDVLILLLLDLLLLLLLWLLDLYLLLRIGVEGDDLKDVLVQEVDCLGVSLGFEQGLHQSRVDTGELVRILLHDSHGLLAEWNGQFWLLDSCSHAHDIVRQVT